MISKLVTKEALLGITTILHQQGKKIVATSGSYDLLNAKHIEVLSEFKQQGDVLVVFLNSDQSIRSYKGPNRPIISESDRILQLSAVSDVAHIILFDDSNPLRLVKELQPDIYCNGADWGTECLEKDSVLAYGGVMYTAKHSRRESTSDIIMRIQRLKDTPDIRAVFLDRDGIIIEDKGYVHTPEDVALMPGIVELLTFLESKGYLLIIVTNQSGIGRGMFTEAAFQTTNDYIIEKLHRQGITITDTFYCPHTPEDGCTCRKPGYALFTEAAKKHGIALARSYMIGDKASDIEAGKFANCKTMFISADRGEQQKSTATHTEESIQSLFTNIHTITL